MHPSLKLGGGFPGKNDGSSIKTFKCSVRLSTNSKIPKVIYNGSERFINSHVNSEFQSQFRLNSLENDVNLRTFWITSIFEAFYFLSTLKIHTKIIFIVCIHMLICGHIYNYFLYLENIESSIKKFSWKFGSVKVQLGFLWPQRLEKIFINSFCLNKLSILKIKTHKEFKAIVLFLFTPTGQTTERSRVFFSFCLSVLFYTVNSHRSSKQNPA